MMKSFAALIGVALMITVPARAEEPADRPPAKGSAELERIKSLVGTWNMFEKGRPMAHPVELIRQK